MVLQARRTSSYRHSIVYKTRIHKDKRERERERERERVRERERLYIPT
jgi:hypothetical protein